MATRLKLLNRRNWLVSLGVFGCGVLLLLFTNATSLSEFPANGVKLNDIIAAANPEIPCPQVIDTFQNGFTSIGSAQQNVQISEIDAIASNVLEITTRNLVSGASNVSQLKFLQGTVSGGWGKSSPLPGRIKAIETISPTSGNLLPGDGLRITGEKLNLDGTVNTSNVVGYIFFTGNVKLAAPAGVVASSGTFLNTFYSNMNTGRSLFVGNAPVAGGTSSTLSFGFKCYDLNPVTAAQRVAISSIMQMVTSDED